MPALLFRATLNAGALDGEPLRLLLAYFGATLLTWITATLMVALVLGRPSPDGAVLSMASTFGNTVMLGIPLAISAFGQQAAAPLALLVSIETPLLWALATVHMTLAARDGTVRPGAALIDIAIDLLRNPIVMAMVLGTAARMAGLVLPEIADRTLVILAQGAVPTALFSVGMTLATYGLKGQLSTLSAICVLKLVAYPAFVWLTAVKIFALPPLWTSIALLLAGMPVGVNAYLFASRYERAVEPVSAALSVSTAIAVITVSALLFVLGSGTP